MEILKTSYKTSMRCSNVYPCFLHHSLQYWIPYAPLFWFWSCFQPCHDIDVLPGIFTCFALAPDCLSVYTLMWNCSPWFISLKCMSLSSLEHLKIFWWVSCFCPNKTHTKFTHLLAYDQPIFYNVAQLGPYAVGRIKEGYIKTQLDGISMCPSCAWVVCFYMFEKTHSFSCFFLIEMSNSSHLPPNLICPLMNHDLYISFPFCLSIPFDNIAGYTFLAP